VGWLIVEDLFIVVVLVLLPALAPLLTGAGGLGEGAAIEPPLHMTKCPERRTSQGWPPLGA